MVFAHPQDRSQIVHFGDNNVQLKMIAARIRRVRDADGDIQQTVVVGERPFARALADELHAEILRIASSADQGVHRHRQSTYEQEEQGLRQFLSAGTVADALAALDSVPARGNRQSFHFPRESLGPVS
jgi:hypothetical protein